MRFLLVDGDPESSEPLSGWLSAHGEVVLLETVRGASRDGVRRSLWSGVVLSLELPDGDGFGVLEGLRDEGWNGPALLIGGSRHSKNARRASALQAFYVPRPAGPEHIASLAEVAQRLTGSPWDRERRVLERRCREAGVTPRETQVLLGVLDGLTLREIAASFGVSPATVHTLAYRIRRRLRVSSLQEAIIRIREASGDG